MGDGETAAAQYDAMAAEYSADNDHGVYNSLYERPAMLALIGDVGGARVLDAGCGAGQLTHEMCEQGASVVGIDASSALIDIAVERLGARASFEVGDLSKPLRFDDGSFNLVVASLVMHYMRDWTPVLQEFRRVLEPEGAVVLSTHHPTMDWKNFSPDNYFAKIQSTETWTKGGRSFDVTFWRRSMAEMSREIRAAGLVIDQLDEPMPDRSLQSVEPSANDYLTTHPHFLFLRLRRI